MPENRVSRAWTPADEPEVTLTCLVIHVGPSQQGSGHGPRGVGARRVTSSSGMGRRDDVDDLVNAGQIAERLDLAFAETVYNWANRYAEFPDPGVARRSDPVVAVARGAGLGGADGPVAARRRDLDQFAAYAGVDTDDTAVLTVDEAAAFLRISRNAAYAAAREWRVTGGRSGLPCISIGRTLRVPRAALDTMLDVSVRPSLPQSGSDSA